MVREKSDQNPAENEKPSPHDNEVIKNTGGSTIVFNQQAIKSTQLRQKSKRNQSNGTTSVIKRHQNDF